MSYLIFISAIPFLGICLLSSKNWNDFPFDRDRRYIAIIYCLSIVPILIMAWLGLSYLKQIIPPYLEIREYHISSDTQRFFMGTDAQKCRVIVTDPSADKMHALIDLNSNQAGIQNISSYRRIQVGESFDNVHSVLIQENDTISINHVMFQVQSILSNPFMGRHQIKFTRHLNGRQDTITASTLLNQPFLFGPEQSSTWFYSPMIPFSLSDHTCVAMIKPKANGLYLILHHPSITHAYKICHNNRLLSEQVKPLNLTDGTLFCMGRTKYHIKKGVNYHGQPIISIRPVPYYPRIDLNALRQLSASSLFLTHHDQRPYGQSVLDIPFDLDHPLKISLESDHHLWIESTPCPPGEFIHLQNKKGDSLVLRYVYPKWQSILDAVQTPIPGSVWVLFSICALIILCAFNVVTKTLHLQTLYIYHFMIIMCTMGLMIACRMAAFDPKYSRWPIENASFLILATLCLLVITNIKWLRWPYLRLKYSLYETRYAINKAIDLNQFFSKSMCHIFSKPMYPSTLIGGFVVLLFGLQVGVGSELGIVVPLIGLFQPVFLCEIFIVLVMAFWTQRNYEAGQMGLGYALATKQKIFLLMNRDLILFAACFIVLPLYVLKDFSPFLIFSTIILVSFCVRPTIPIPLRLSVLGLAFILLMVMVAYPDMLGRTLSSRIEVWKNPWIKTEKGFQFIQNLWLLKGIGFWGNGFGGTDISVHFPALHRDFMVSLFIGDFGPGGLMGLILLWVGFLVTLFSQSQKSFGSQNENMQFIKSIMAWLAFLFMLHTWFIMGSNLGLFPVMGIPLPFLARGFSCLFFLCFLGMALCIICTDQIKRSQTWNES